MITIAQSHYRKLIETIELLQKNTSFFFPSQPNLEEIQKEWKRINEVLNEIYSSIHHSLAEIQQKNSNLAAEHQQLREKIEVLTLKNEEQLKINTVLRAELAKNVAEYNKLKEVAKAIKTKLKENEQILKQKNEALEQLGDKGKKYKKLYQQQVKKVEKLDKMVSVLEVTQRSSAKQKELDQQMQQLQAELQNIENINDFQQNN